MQVFLAHTKSCTTALFQALLQLWRVRNNDNRIGVEASLVALLCFGALTLPAGMASAGYDIGSEQTSRGPGTEYASWNQSMDPDYLTAKATTNNNLANGRCLDVFFDWGTNAGIHWDSRVVRNCYPGSTRETDQSGNGVFRESEARAIVTLQGAQRAAGCIFFTNGNTYVSNDAIVECSEFAGSRFEMHDGLSFPATQSLANNHFQMWVRYPNGNRDLIPGGVASDGEN